MGLSPFPRFFALFGVLRRKYYSLTGKVVAYIVPIFVWRRFVFRKMLVYALVIKKLYWRHLRLKTVNNKENVGQPMPPY